MPLTKLNLNLDPKIFAEHGVNINDNSLAERVNDRNKQMNKLYNQQAKRKNRYGLQERLTLLSKIGNPTSDRIQLLQRILATRHSNWLMKWLMVT